jgi:class 3 adenylate cyclase
VGAYEAAAVMFCDLVGTTSISAQLDAREWRDLVDVYVDVDAASAAVMEMGGHVAKNLGEMERQVGAR